MHINTTFLIRTSYCTTEVQGCLFDKCNESSLSNTVWYLVFVKVSQTEMVQLQNFGSHRLSLTVQKRPISLKNIAFFFLQQFIFVSSVPLTHSCLLTREIVKVRIAFAISAVKQAYYLNFASLQRLRISQRRHIFNTKQC